MYALGLPFYGVYKLLVPTFYAIDRQRVPVIASLLSIAFNVAFCLLLTPIYGFKILALGTTLSVLVNAGFQCLMLKKDLSLSWGFFFSLRIFKVFVATLTSAVVVETLLKVEFFHQPFLSRCLFLGAQIFAIGLVYLTCLIFLGERASALAILSKVTQRFRR